METSGWVGRRPNQNIVIFLVLVLGHADGIGLIFYSQEPLYHLFNNPYVGNVSGTPEEIAYSLTLYDWTFNVWALYGLLSIIIGYLYYNKGRALKLSSIFPGRTQEWFKNLIDVLMALVL